MQKGRSGLYSLWDACIRVGVRPPGLAESFEDCSIEEQAHIIGYDQIKSVEEDERFELNLKAQGAKF